MTTRYKKNWTSLSLLHQTRRTNPIVHKGLKKKCSTFSVLILLFNNIFAVHSDGFPMQFDRICAEWSILYFSGHRWNFLNHYAFLSIRLVFCCFCLGFFANSVDPDKISPWSILQYCRPFIKLPFVIKTFILSIF